MSSTFATELRRVAGAPLVQYRELMALKRRVLEALASWLFQQDSERRAKMDSYIASHPAVQDYAAFRAKTERERKSWLQWPAARRACAVRPEDYDAEAERYHLYVQWQCAEQVAALREQARAGGVALYLDFPLGTNRDGYDVWREPALFALDMNGGAPPDGLFIKGQNWGFPPLHPEAIRRQGYRYYIDCLRHHMACANMLRMDHVMGLHRAFWIPDGFSAADGLYLHYGRALQKLLLLLVGLARQDVWGHKNHGFVSFAAGRGLHSCLGPCTMDYLPAAAGPSSGKSRDLPRRIG